MSPEKQLDILKQIFLDRTKLLYNSTFMMKLTIASSNDPKWFEKRLSIIDALCVQFDESVMLKNPKRAAKYLSIISKVISDLKIRTEHITLEFEQQSLLV